MQLVPGLKNLPYFYEENHGLLNINADHAKGPNIGANGCNLTITFLSMNRTSLSMRLLESIVRCVPDFEGEVLIIDNGSAQEELTRLSEYCQTLPLNVRIEQMGENLGVSKGRNRTIDFVNTEWIMFLDNDIYFIKDPLTRIQKDLATLGSHFISLPLLDSDEKTTFAYGGNIYVGYHNEEIHVGGGSVSRQIIADQGDKDGFLSTFLFGGACVLKKSSFVKLGGYDNGMFVGFEDIDFSIRLFQEGYKVATCGAMALVHDHAKPDTNMDKTYEKTRFSRNILKESADYLEIKHGFRFWAGCVDDWLESKHKTLALDSAEGQTEAVQTEFPGETVITSASAANPGSVEIAPLAVFTPAKPKVALVVDADNWAFANIANQIVKHLSHRFEFQIIPTFVVDNVCRILMMTKDFDMVHFFWRESINQLHTEYFETYVRNLGYTPEEFKQKYVYSRKITSAVYDHLYLGIDQIAERVDLFGKILDGYTVSSQKLFQIYLETTPYQAPTLIAEDGVDLGLFAPKNLERFDSLDKRPMVIGWAGNSKWAAELSDFKGFHSILLPAISKLKAEGIPIETHFADRQDGFIEHADMPEYYAKIDVYVCASAIEGTPNPVLESMACGVPVVSTDVGLVPDAFGGKQKDFIVHERSVDELANKLRTLYAGGPTLFKSLSDENLEYIRKWDWSHKAKNFEMFFNHILSAKR